MLFRSAKAVAGDASAFAAPQVLHALTLGGATALGLQERIGSIELGKEADLVAIDMAGLACSPCMDPLSHLVYVCGREQVSDVWIRGEPVVRMRQPVSIALHELRDRLRSRLPLWQNQVVSQLNRLNRQTVV